MPWWYTILKDQLTLSEFVSAEQSAAARQWGVNCILSLQSDADLAWLGVNPANLAQALAQAGLEYHRFPIADGAAEPLAEALPAALEKLHELIQAGRHVLLHCNAAMNRSPSVAAAYLMRYRGQSKKEVLNSLRQARPDCIPFEEVLDEIGTDD